MKTTIYLIRHGQTEWNLESRMQGHKNSPLTELGIKQAEKLHHRLVNENFDLIYCSDSSRAQHTAEIIRGNADTEINLNSALIEINMGNFEGMKQSEIISKYPENWNNFWHDPASYIPSGNGEYYDDLKNRLIPAINEIISSNIGKKIVIVTHRIALKVIMAYFNGQSINDIAKNPDLKPASLSKICIENNIPTVLMYGDTSHYN
ncbi:MAG: histidine phosphatase family protein [Clostridium sp.]|nr:histidine phosphatase family protein [Clostridium sp.]